MTPGETLIEDGDLVLALTNVTARAQRFTCPRGALGRDAADWRDRLGGRTVGTPEGALAVDLEPYEVLWLSPAG